MPRGENLAADRPPKAREGKTAASVEQLGDFESPDELVRLTAARRFVAEVMVDPTTASKDRPPLVRSFLEVDAKVVALEESRRAEALRAAAEDAQRGNLKLVPGEGAGTFDAARFA